MNALKEVLLEPAKVILAQLGDKLIKAVGVLIILFIGWWIAKGIRALVTRALRLIKLDDISDSVGIDGILEKGGIKYSLSELFGALCYWVVVLVSIVVAVNAIGLNAAADLLNKIILYIPNIIAALFIIIAGLFISTLVRNIVLTAANNAGISYAHILSRFAEVIIIAFAVLMALEQVRIGVRISTIAMTIVLGSVGLAAGLAFGLGCKDIAGRYMNEWIERLKKK